MRDARTNLQRTRPCRRERPLVYRKSHELEDREMCVWDESISPEKLSATQVLSSPSTVKVGIIVPQQNRLLKPGSSSVAMEHLTRAKNTDVDAGNGVDISENAHR